MYSAVVITIFVLSLGKSYSSPPLSRSGPDTHNHHNPYGPHAAKLTGPYHDGKPGLDPRIPFYPPNGVGVPSQPPPPVTVSILALPKRKVLSTNVICEKTHMIANFTFSTGFDGYIYPYNAFDKCILFNGYRSKYATIQLKHGICGDKSDIINVQDRNHLNPIMEHRLMVQWEKDFVCDDDTSVIVRCDRPDDFNRTVKWEFQTLQLASTLEHNTHPGPKMFMEIQKGEGPTAPSLETPVYIGDLLTLVFTLSDNVFWFDSNILTCTALDGNGDGENVQFVDLVNGISQRSRLYSGQMKVIEDACTVKPKVFSHFYKEKETLPDGNLVTLHYAYFKAFRFPTSEKVVIQCDVSVCYRNCEELPPCSSPIEPHYVKTGQRKRRSVDENDDPRAKRETGEDDAFEIDNFNFQKSLTVRLPEEGALREVKINAGNETIASLKVVPYEECYSHSVFVGLIISLVSCLVLIILGLIYYSSKRPNYPAKYCATPGK